MPIYNSNNKLINSMGGEINEVKMNQDNGESFRIGIRQEHGESLNVNLGMGITTNTNISNTRGKPLKIKIDDKEDYLYRASSEAKLAGKSLLTLGIIGILYGNGVKISTFVGTNIDDEKNFIGGILILSLFIELLLFLVIFYRDLIKYKTHNREIEINNIIKMRQMYQRGKNILSQADIDKIEENSGKQEKSEIEMEDLKNNISEIKNQSIHKNVIVFLFQTFYPLFIGVLGIKYLILNGYHLKLTKIFSVNDILLLILLFIIFTASIYIIFKTKKLSYK